MEKEKIVYKKVEDLKLNPKNPRKNDDAVDTVAKSIEKYGFKNPLIIDENNVVWCGNTRLKASKKLGLKEVPCIVASDLTEQQIRELALIDNKSSEIAEWDFDLLGEELLELDLGEFELDWGLTELVEEEKEVVEDDFDCTPSEQPKAKLGDIYQLGNHRLMCGDSTKEEDVSKLMSGEKADMVFTDPPYGVSYTGGVIHGNEINKDHKREMLKNDDIDIYSDFIPLINRFIEDGAIYIFYATCNSYQLLKPLHDNDIEINSIIVWNKINTGYADMNSNYKNKYEPCVYCKRKGHKLNFVGATNECTVWDIEKDRDNKLHPTQKPIAVPYRAIKNSSNIGGKVLDFFGGSGSTLIACEQLNRNCYMMELDPKYVDVIINRWEQFTGKKAEKLN